MAMANDKPAPDWRNLAAWSAAGAGFYILVVVSVSLFVHKGGAGANFQSKTVLAELGLALIFSMAVAGFSNRKRQFGLRTLRNFLIQNAVAVIAFLLVIWGFSGLARAGATGMSAWVAAVMGATLVVLPVLGSLAVASAHTSADILDRDAAEELRERSRLFLYSFAWTAGCGLLLILLALAGPVGIVSPVAALAGVLALIALLVVLGIAAHRLSDELAHTLSREAGTMAFYLIFGLGGGWAMLAHLGFVAAPAPLDWLTLFIVLLFAASIIATGRRKLLTV